MAKAIDVPPPTGNSQKDMAAIKAAIEAANKAYMQDTGAGQVIVKLAAGTYAVTGTPGNPSKGGVELLSGVALVGDGMGKTVIRLDDGFNERVNGIVRTALTDVSNVSISNLTIDGNRANNTGHQAGFICGAKAEENKIQDDITLSGVEIKNCTAYGFNPHEVTTNVTIENSVSHGNGLDGFVADHIIGSTYRNNVAYNNDRHGFNIQNATDGLVLANNKAFNNGSAGLVIQRGDIPPEGQTALKWVTNIQVVGGEYYRNAKEGILVKLSDDVTISGAQVYGNFRQGIRIEGSTDTIVRDSFVFNNSQEAHDTYDEIQIRLRLDDALTNLTYYSTNTQILNNTIYSNGWVKARYGIREERSNLDGGPAGTTLIGNKVSGMAKADVSVPGFIREGTSGDDLMAGTDDDDIMHGLGGNDTYVVNHSKDVVVEQQNQGTDDHVRSSITYTLTSHVEHLTLVGSGAINGYGNELNNRVTGNAANNVIKAAGGDDTLIGGGGADTLEGGDGNDTYHVDSADDVIVEKVNGGLGGLDRIYSSANYALPTAVEWLILTGSAIIAVGNAASGNNLVGNALNNVLDGSSGADRMEGGLGDDTYYVDDPGDLVAEAFGGGSHDQIATYINYMLPANVEHILALGTDNLTLIGNELDNRINGNAGANVLRGGAGHDTINGGAGADFMEGGDGNDIYYVDNAFDFTSESATGGADTVYSSVSYSLADGIENVFLSGSALWANGNFLANTLVGNSSKNTLNGFGGADRMEGRAGNDVYYVDNRGDRVIETASGGKDDKVFTSITYTLPKHVERLAATGSGAVSLTGNTLSNSIAGNDASNKIKGGAGNDTLNGRFGNDKLTGGAGRDKFVFNTALNKKKNVDTITDFKVVDDTISLDNAIFKKLGSKTGTLKSTMFNIGSSAKDSSDRIIYNNKTGVLLYDKDGAGGAAGVAFAKVSPNLKMTAADFLVI